MQAVQAAALARLEAVYVAARVHGPNEVPDSPSLPYAVVSANTGSPRNYLGSGEHGSRQFRIAVQCIGRTAADCLFVAEKADAAFLDQVLTVTGWDCTRTSREISGGQPVRDPNGSTALSILQTYTFEATQVDDESSSS